MTRHLLDVDDLAPAELARVLDLAQDENPPRVLAGRGVALVFQKPSARTRNSSEVAVFQLGGHPVTVRGDEVGIDSRESAEDVARTLAQYHAAIGAGSSTTACSSAWRPCQACPWSTFCPTVRTRCRP